MKPVNVAVVFLVGAIVAACSANSNELEHVRLPDGFQIEVYAEVPMARSLAAGPDGVFFVSTRRSDEVFAIINHESGEREVVVLDDGLDTPNGIAYKDGDLYVAEIDRIFRYTDIDDRLHDMPEPEVLDIDLPSEKHHGWRYIGFGPDGKLYISIGAPCNVCDEDGFNVIERMNPDGSDREVYADGIRNSVGFNWHPDTGELWFTDNGRDMLGDDLPPDELNYAPEKGMHFGYPYCHGGFYLDPEYGEGHNCDDYTPPAQRLGPHVASLGFDFYDGTEFPQDYRGHIFIAEHGSWNRSEKIGYRITMARLEGNAVVAYEVFADGWHEGNTVYGRPVDVLVLDDGSMLVSDDQAGLVYRIYYDGQ